MACNIIEILHFQHFCTAFMSHVERGNADLVAAVLTQGVGPRLVQHVQRCSTVPAR